MSRVATGHQWIYISQGGSYSEVTLPVGGAKAARLKVKTSDGVTYPLAIEARFAATSGRRWQYRRAFFHAEQPMREIKSVVDVNGTGRALMKNAWRVSYFERYGAGKALNEEEQGWMPYMVTLARLRLPHGFYAHKSLLLDAISQDADLLRRLGMANYFKLREAWGETVRANPRRKTR